MTCYLHELLTEAGIDFRIDGERLIAGPVELLTDEISNEILNHKSALMAAVQLAEWQAQWASIEEQWQYGRQG